MSRAQLEYKEIRLVRQYEALARMARNESLARGNWTDALREITEAASSALELQRVSIWLFDETHTYIRCIDLFERSTLSHSQGALLAAKDYPAYFHALEEELTIAAHDAHTDPRTREFSANYLGPLEISSMLDAPVRVSGRMVGVVCHEHVGPPRRWFLDEQNFAGSVAGLLSLALETAERNRAEQKLRRSEEHFRALIENALDIITVVDAADSILYVSPSLERILGYTAEEVVGRKAREFFHPDDLGLTDSLLKEFFEKPESPVHSEFRLRHKNGSWRKMKFVGRNLLNDPAVGGIVVNYQDVTEIRNAEKLLEEYRVNLENKVVDRTRELNEKNLELQDALDQLRQTQQELVMHSKMAALGSLVAGVAHEINNPVGAVNSAADVCGRCIDRMVQLLDNSQDIEELKRNPQFQQFLSLLKENQSITVVAGQRIARIVQSLKNFARLDEAEYQRADVHEGIESSLTLLQHETKNKAIIVKEFGDIPQIFCYPNQLNQVFMNLLVNAVQAIENDGIIRIQTSSDESNVYIKIVDNGKGIPAENQSRVFDPGFTTKGVGVGTGLGLSIAYNIVLKHKGDIKLESQVGKGTNFTIRLPIHPQLDN